MGVVFIGPSPAKRWLITDIKQTSNTKGEGLLVFVSHNFVCSSGEYL